MLGVRIHADVAVTNLKTFLLSCQLLLKRAFGLVEKNEALSELYCVPIYVNRSSLQKFLERNHAPSLETTTRRALFVISLIRERSPIHSEKVQSLARVSGGKPRTPEEFIEWCTSNPYFTEENKRKLNEAYTCYFSGPHQKYRERFRLDLAKQNFLEWVSGAQGHFPRTPMVVMKRILAGVGGFESDDVLAGASVSMPHGEASRSGELRRREPFPDIPPSVRTPSSGPTRAIKEVAFGGPENPETGFLSNEYECNVIFGGVPYRCAEAAYQAQKFPGHESEFRNLNADNAKTHAKRLSDEGIALRVDWREVNAAIMKQIIRAKFQDADLQRRLCALGSVPLVLNSEDTFWGRRKDGSGANRLGLILEETRDEYSCSLPAGVTWPSPAPEPDVLAEPPTPSPSALSGLPGPSRSPNQPTTAKQFQKWCQKNRYFNTDNKKYLADAYDRFFFKPYADCQMEVRPFDLERAKRNFLRWFQGAQRYFRHTSLEFMRGILEGVGSFDEAFPPEPIASPERAAVSASDSPAPPPAPEVDSPTPPRSPHRDVRSARPAQKLLQLPPEKSCPPFIPLTEHELDSFLRRFPMVMSSRAHHDGPPMLQFINMLHSIGAPAFGLSPEVNRTVVHQMQFVMYKIAHTKDSDAQQILLMNLIEGLTECIPVAQQRIDGMYQKFVGSSGFEAGFEAFIRTQKEQAVDRVLHRMYPRFEASGYDPSSDSPWNQFPHLKNGFVKVLGRERGFRLEGADADRHANYVDPSTRREDFLRFFDEEFSIPKLIQEFVCQVNGPAADAWSRDINNEDFYKWCGDNGLGEECVYQEELAYPSYSPALEEAHRDLTAAYITEQTALSVFERLGYIEPAPAS